jgi:hypothetical protein
MIPGFMQLLQDDQIALLKSGSYGIMLLHLSKIYLPEIESFCLNNGYLYLSFFINNYSHKLNTEEIDFIKSNIVFLNQLKQYNLSDSELAILSAIILFNPDNVNIIDRKFIHNFNQQFIEVLRIDIENNQHHSCLSSLVKQQMLQQLLNLISVNLMKISISHYNLIKQYKIKKPFINFPPLHKELFNIDLCLNHNERKRVNLNAKDMSYEMFKRNLDELPQIKETEQNNLDNNIISSPLSCSSASSLYSAVKT